MANDHPAAPVGSVGFDELIPLAHRINTVSDDLNSALKRIEDRLNALVLGIESFVPIPDTREVASGDKREPEEWHEYHLGYGRLGNRWALLTRRAYFHDDPSMTALPASCWEFTDEKPLQRSSRELRVKAVAAIPDLLKQLKGEADSVLKTVETAQHLAGTTFEFGETVASNAFWDRNPKFFSAFTHLVNLTNKCFGRTLNPRNRVEDLGFDLGETCRQDFFEIVFLGVNGHGIGAQKLLRGLYERAVALEYIRTHPKKAEKFVRYAAVQEFKIARKTMAVVAQEQFDIAVAGVGTSFEKIKALYDTIAPEFQITKRSKCKTKETAFSWDIDIASMVNTIGEPYTNLYLSCYSIPTLHIHATLASASSRESIEETREERKIHDAEVSLIMATLTFLSVIRSQNKIFSLALDDEIQECYREVSEVWQNRPSGPRATAPDAEG